LRKKERKEGRIRRERVNLISAVSRGYNNNDLRNSILGNPQMLPKADWTQPYSTLPCTLVQTGS
jgi:hypothetical protein